MEQLITKSNRVNTMGTIKHNYTKTEKAKSAWERQVKHLHTEVNNNKIYWDEFVKNSGKSETSLVQYKSTIFNFMETINKDLCLVTREDIENFVADAKNEKTRNNKIAHIKSILTYIVHDNVADCLDRFSKETLILIISL
ncbi:phage integrase N-terminal SAM-like domain-containing protein [Clostridium sp.]|uniref:phage integrase N-terminal SAM-like domain-containing protein n=1 Tax=Clostridium sp. TaxID=1506 RepID=UPI00261D1258|nr:phage integrase N-terminal SAM-like domain-containing protein [Clostridium sp.]